MYTYICILAGGKCYLKKNKSSKELEIIERKRFGGGGSFRIELNVDFTEVTFK